MADPEKITAHTALDPLDIVIGGPSDAGVTLAEIPFQTRLVLRGQPTDSKFMAAVKKALGIAPPTEPGAVASAKATRVLWTGPNEWMIYSDDVNLTATMTQAVAGIHAAVTEVTEHYTLIRLSGRHARDVMIKGCAIDLHPREFGPGQCVQSHLGRITVLFDQIDETPTYDILVRASFAEYLWMYLEDAGLEFGVRIEANG